MIKENITRVRDTREGVKRKDRLSSTSTEGLGGKQVERHQEGTFLGQLLTGRASFRLGVNQPSTIIFLIQKPKSRARVMAQ